MSRINKLHHAFSPSLVSKRLVKANLVNSTPEEEEVLALYSWSADTRASKADLLNHELRQAGSPLLDQGFQDMRMELSNVIKKG